MSADAGDALPPVVLVDIDALLLGVGFCALGSLSCDDLAAVVWLCTGAASP